MFRDQMRRESAVLSLMWYLPIAVLAGVFLWGVSANTTAELGPIPYRNHTEGVYQILVFVWSLLFGFLINSGFTRHCSGPVDLNLPLPTRRLWLNHNLAILLSGMTILSVTVAVICLGNWLQGTLPLLRPGMISFAIHLAVGMILAVALLQSIKPCLWSIPIDRGYVIRCVLVFAGYLALTVLLSALPLIWVLVPLGVALMLNLRTYRALPAAFVTAPATVEHTDSVVIPTSKQTVRVSGGSVSPPHRLNRYWLVYGSIWRSALGQWTWFYLPIFFIYGVILADFERGPHALFFPLAWIMLVSWTLVFLRGLGRVHPWPISRRRIFNVLIAAALLPLVGGFGFGSLGRMAWGESPRGVTFGTVSCCGVIEVPFENWKISWDGPAPPSTAPWGETAKPREFPLVRGRPAVLYKPYPIAPESTVDFAAWQISRAVAEVHGLRLPYQEIRDRYLETGPDGRVQLKVGKFTLLGDHRDSRTPWAMRTFPAIMTLICLPWFLCAALVFRLQRADVTPHLAHGVGLLVFVPTVVLAIGMLAVAAWGWLDLWAISRTSGILLGELGEHFPGGMLSIWSLCLILLAGGYWLALGRFRSLEVQQTISRGFGK